MTNRVLSEVRNGVLIITLNRPEALNALENSMIAAINTQLDAAKSDEQVRAVLFRGAGRGLSAGDDLKDMGTETHPEPKDLQIRYMEGYPAIVKRIRSLEKPVVVSLKGFALGAACEIALASDVIVAESKAKIGLPFVLRGIASGTVLAPRLLPEHLAKRLLLLGEMLPADTLKPYGIVSRFVDPEEGSVDDEALSVATDLAKSATRAIGLMKAAIHETAGAPYDAAWRTQVSATAQSVLTDDFLEGKAAFAEKRTPDFRGK